MNLFICEIIKIRNYDQQFTAEKVKMITSVPVIIKCCIPAIASLASSKEVEGNVCKHSYF